MIKRIRAEYVEVGMFIEDFNTPWMDHPFLTGKKEIKSAREIDLLLKHRIEEVYINAERGKDSGRAISAGEANARIRDEMKKEVLDRRDDEEFTATVAEPTHAGTDAFEAELPQARRVYTEAKSLVKDLLHDARMGKSVDGKRAAQVVDDMVDSIFRNSDALTGLSRLKSFDDYTFHHSINVSVLALALGRHLGIVKGELRRLGIGAILHDVGKICIPDEILKKPGRLTDEEFTLVRTHSLHGAKILMAARSVPDECAAVALNHHERFNGHGYPRGIQGVGIGKFGLISAIVDVYDAITSNRVYHKGMPSHQAMQKLYEWGKTDFHPIYIQKFIQAIGIYPAGSVVRLDTGEVGVVFKQNRDQLLRPWVRIFRGSSGEVLDPPIDVNLAEPDPTELKPYSRTVTEPVDPGHVGVDVESLLTPGEG